MFIKQLRRLTSVTIIACAELLSGSDDFLSEIDLSNGGFLAYAKLYF